MPPRNLEELKVIFCTRFYNLRPLLELEQTSQIKIEFRTDDQDPHMEIQNDIDLVSAFYTCNEIQQICLLVRITVEEKLAKQLELYNKERAETRS